MLSNDRQTRSPPAYEEEFGPSLTEQYRVDPCDPNVVRRLNSLPSARYLSYRRLSSGKMELYLSEENFRRLANAVFGSGGWCSSVMEQRASRPQQLDNGKFQCECSVVIKIECRCYVCLRRRSRAWHEGIGSCVAEQESADLALSIALQTAHQDGLQRGLRNFGVVFGDFTKDPNLLGRVIEQTVTQEEHSQERELNQVDILQQEIAGHIQYASNLNVIGIQRSHDGARSGRC